MFDIIIYNNDLDGITGVYVYLFYVGYTEYGKSYEEYLKYKEEIFKTTEKLEKENIGEIRLYPDKPSSTKLPFDISDKEILIINVKYTKVMIESILEKVKKLLLINSHTSINNDMNEIKNDKFEYYYNKTKSGASLTWNYFFNKIPLPRFIKYIEQNYLGHFNYKNILEFIQGLEVTFEQYLDGNNFNPWILLFDNKVIDDLIEEGKYYLLYAYHIIKKESTGSHIIISYFPSKIIYNKFKNFFMGEKEYKVGIYNGSLVPSISFFSNFVVDRIDIDFFITWTYNINKGIYTLLLKSKEGKTDVGKIAKLFNGSGSENAATFILNDKEYDIKDLFSIPKKIYKKN